MKLNPKQKKIAAGVAVGGVLALFALMRRSSTSGGQDATANTTSTGIPADYSAASGASFADNGASAGQLGTSVSDLTTAVNGLIGSLPDAISSGVAAAIPSQLTTPAATIGQPAGNAGSTALPDGGGNPALGPGFANLNNPAPPPAAPAPRAISSGPQTVVLASGGSAVVGSIVQKPSVAHGGRLYDFRVNSNGSLTPLRPASGH